MSEYWKSTPKYWCKHCSIYVKDTPFERKQHESTGKHQGNLKRFLRDIQNSHERNERDKVRAKEEVDRLKSNFGSPVSPTPPTTSSRGAAASPHLPVGRKVAAAPPSAADQKRQWTQLADMGIKVPEQFRSEMAMAGEWNTTPTTVPQDILPEKSLSIGVKRRKLDRAEEESEAGDAAGSMVRRGWGAATKRFPGQDDADLDDLLAGSRSLAKKEKQMSLGKHESADDPRSSCHKLEGRISTPVDADADIKISGRAELRVQPVDSRDMKVTDDNVKLVKQEPGEPRAAITTDTCLEEPPVPVFKKRKAKVS